MFADPPPDVPSPCTSHSTPASASSYARNWWSQCDGKECILATHFASLCPCGLQKARERLGLPADMRDDASAERVAALTGLTAGELRACLELCIARLDSKRIDPGALQATVMCSGSWSICNKMLQQLLMPRMSLGAVTTGCVAEPLVLQSAFVASLQPRPR